MFWAKNKTVLITLLAAWLTGDVLQAEVTLEENITYGKGGGRSISYPDDL